MSMMGVLGKVAMGILVAKGAGKIMGGGASSGGSLLDGLGGLLGGGASATDASGGLGGLLGSLSGSKQIDQNKNDSPKDFASLFNDAIQGKDSESTAEQNRQAEVLLHAMVSAAKADGSIDITEQKKILGQLNDVSEEDTEMVREIVQAPLDLQELINSVPKNMERQVYLISLLVINLDSKEEAAYLDKLAKGLKISNETSNQIHDKLGAPKLY